MLSVLGLIPARAGSKGVRDKNLRPLLGRPLIDYSIDVARSVSEITRVVVSTDSERIAAHARKAGAEVPFMRPADLATDAAPMGPVIEQALGALSEQGWAPDIVMLLQPTAPLRKREHVLDALRQLAAGDCDSVVSVVRVPQHYSPQYVMRIEDDMLKPFVSGSADAGRRQDVETAFSRDGTVYAFWADRFLATGSIYGDVCRPLEVPLAESVNIDTAEDWISAEAAIEKRTEAGR